MVDSDHLEPGGCRSAGETEVTGEQRAPAVDREEDIEHIVSAEVLDQSHGRAERRTDVDPLGIEQGEMADRVQEPSGPEFSPNVESPESVERLGVDSGPPLGDRQAPQAGDEAVLS